MVSVRTAERADYILSLSLSRLPLVITADREIRTILKPCAPAPLPSGRRRDIYRYILRSTCYLNLIRSSPAPRADKLRVKQARN